MKGRWIKGALGVIVPILTSNAYIYEIQVMRKWNQPTYSYQYFIGCSDYHDKLDSANLWQREELTKILTQSDKKQTLVLVEDLNSANTQGHYTCEGYFLNGQKGILASFTKVCHRLGIEVRNVEYRYSRAISLAGLLADVTQNPYSSQSACSIRVAHLLDELEGTLSAIAAYQAPLFLKLLYYRACANARSEIKRLFLTQEKKSSIAAFCHKRSLENSKLAFLKYFLTFDSTLLDCKLLNEVVHAKSKNTIVALAGGTHIARVCDVLTKIGFERICSTKSSSCSGKVGSSQAIGVCTQGAKKEKPVPVSLKIVRKYVVSGKVYF